MTGGFVFIHGWGFGPDFWDGVRREIGAAPSACVDLGFRGAASCPDLPSGPLVGIVHSLGSLLALRHAPLFSALLIVNGFTRFTRGHGYPSGVALPVLRRMQKALEERPFETWRDFVENCGGRDIALPASLGFGAMNHGLSLLASNRTLGLPKIPIQVLAGAEDKIVLPDHTKDCFAGNPIEWIEGGGHLLPLTHPARCAEMALRLLTEARG